MGIEARHWPSHDLRARKRLRAQFIRPLDDALKYKIKNGQAIGRPPYGKKIRRQGVCVLVDEPDEQDGLKVLLDLYSTFSNNPTVIADVMNQSGIPYRGRRWKTRDVERTLAQDKFTR